MALKAPCPPMTPVEAELAGRRLVQVLALAEALPYEPDAELRYPDLRTVIAKARADERARR